MENTILQTEGISQSFGSPQDPLEILHRIHLYLEAGEMVALLGTSGSGKSTLLNILGLLATPASGSYQLVEQEVTELDRRELASLRLAQIGFIFQSFHLIPYKNVLDNVELPLLYQGISKAQRHQRAEEIIERLGLRHRINANIETLSGGEKQRVAIARAVVTRPRLILADEPTGALDSERSREVIDLLRELTGPECATLVVTHDAQIAARCDRVLYIEDGRLVSPPQQLLRELAKSDRPREKRPKLELEREGRSGYGGTGKELVEAEERRKLGTNGARDRKMTGRSFPWLLPALVEGWRASFARLRRNVFTMLGVALGVAALTLTVGLSNTIASQISDTFDIYQARKVTLQQVSRTTPDLEEIGAILTGENYARLSTLNGVSRVAGYRTISSGLDLSLTPFGPKLATSPTLATEPSLFEAQDQQLIFGRLPLAGEGGNLAVLGQSLFEKLGVTWQEGIIIYLEGQPLQVIGVVTENTAASGYYGAIYLPMQIASYPESEDFKILLKVDEGAANQVSKEAPYALSPAAPGLYTSAVPPAPENLKKAVDQQQKNLLIAMALITLIIGAVGTMNTFLVGVMERRQEIGLRLAIGTRPVSITLQLALETVLTSLLGSLAGVLFSINTIALVSLLNRWTPVISLEILVLGLGVGFVLGLLAGIYPAYRASRIDPIQSLTLP